MERLLTSKEVAEFVGLKPITIIRKANKGEIPAIKLGRQFRFQRDQIEKWLIDSKIKGQPRILVVDDEIDICELMEIVLEKAGFMVTKATTGSKAIELLDEQQFDLLFLDLGMPEVGGLEILSHIKSEKINVEIVIITGYDEGARIMSAAMQYGPLFVMKKPFSNEEIIDITSRFIGRPD